MRQSLSATQPHSPKKGLLKCEKQVKVSECESWLGAEMFYQCIISSKEKGKKTCVGFIVSISAEIVKKKKDKC